MRSVAMSLLISVALITAIWLVGQAAGFRISLVASIALTIGLTLLVNLVIAAYRGSDRVLRSPQAQRP
jgi:hypothetical protein